ncbi:hypothetical protein [Bradyrhizobium sp. WU425]|jgi:hypothetical protein|uniref:hypothetical protein n=1 Tax=Bradyrhizobium sp. WU425 TaxID=187029 RepID=UPI001E33BA17|nr:hypothetical protein [Bradyrhizobium canariense]UFW69201.1 hypothetical protein BcanWU425_20765 [Bradyrhizobium canariense]
MADRIDEFLDSLEPDQLRDCGNRIRKRLGRGRPEGATSKTAKTLQSRFAAQLVRRLRDAYMRKKQTTSVPDELNEEFLIAAMEKYPQAKKSTAREHVRKDRTYRHRLKSGD